MQDSKGSVGSLAGEVISRERLPAALASWVTLIASFILSFTTWLALGRLTGYSDLSFALPFCVDGYIVTALVTWMSPVSERVARFARWNTYAAAAIGVVTQSAYHGLKIYSDTHVGWQSALATVVGAIPPLFAALSVHLRGLVIRSASQPSQVSPNSEQPVEAVADPPLPPLVSIPPRPIPVPAPVIRRAPEPVQPRPEPVVTKPAPVKKPSSEPGRSDEELTAEIERIWVDLGRRPGIQKVKSSLGIGSSRAEKLIAAVDDPLASRNGHKPGQLVAS